MKTTIFGFWIVLLSPTFAEAGELVFKPVQVGREGPLLFFTHPEGEQGKSVRDSSQRNEVLYLYDPSYHDKPQQLWLGDRPPVPKPIVRLKQNVVLMTTMDDHCFFLHLDTGSISPLLPGPEETEVIHIERDNVLFVKRELPKASTGYRLGRKRSGIPELADRMIGTKWSGPTVAKQDQRPRDYFTFSLLL